MLLKSIKFSVNFVFFNVKFCVHHLNIASFGCQQGSSFRRHNTTETIFNDFDDYFKKYFIFNQDYKWKNTVSQCLINSSDLVYISIARIYI